MFLSLVSHAGAEVREMVRRADLDGDQRINFDEFYNIMTNKQYQWKWLFFYSSSWH